MRSSEIKVAAIVPATLPSYLRVVRDVLTLATAILGGFGVAAAVDVVPPLAAVGLGGCVILCLGLLARRSDGLAFICSVLGCVLGAIAYWPLMPDWLAVIDRAWSAGVFPSLESCSAFEFAFLFLPICMALVILITIVIAVMTGYAQRRAANRPAATL